MVLQCKNITCVQEIDLDLESNIEICHPKDNTNWKHFETYKNCTKRTITETETDSDSSTTTTTTIQWYKIERRNCSKPVKIDGKECNWYEIKVQGCSPSYGTWSEWSDFDDTHCKFETELEEWRKPRARNCSSELLSITFSGLSPL